MTNWKDCPIKWTLDTSLSQDKQQAIIELDHLHTSLISTQSSHTNHTRQLNKQMDDLSTELNGLSFKLVIFNTSLSQHQQKTTAELAHLQTSLNSIQFFYNTELNSKLGGLYFEIDGLSSKLKTVYIHFTQYLKHFNSTNFKLNSLTVTAGQLSSDHQAMQTNISDVGCIDAQQTLNLNQNLQDNIANQLVMIK